MKFFKATLPGLSGLLLYAFVANHSLADDISVFSAELDTTLKPNVLFVLDYSGSMKDDVDGADPSVTGLPAKIDILRDAVASLLSSNADAMNIGVGPLYSWSSGGIQWPISSLTAKANTVDPGIPASVTSAEVVDSLLTNKWAGSGTATVPALIEAALYFRGGPVAAGGANAEDPGRFTPSSWDNPEQRYTGGYHLAPHPATYDPSNAYVFDAADATGLAYCSDYTASGGENYCEGLATTDCEFKPGSTSYEGGASSDRTVCTYPHPDKWNGANYISPIVNECQKNYMILVSDGQPTAKGNFDALEELLGFTKESCEDLSNSIFGEPEGTKEDGNCGPELVSMLANNNHNPDIEDSWVKTSTIGFSVDGSGKDYLERLATDGGGAFYEASSPESLAAVLAEFVDQIRESSENFAELTVDVDKANFSHDNKVYFPLFKPSLQQTWAGNVKGYFIDQQGLKDINNLPATEQGETGTQFSSGAQSFWSAEVDGNDVTLGGASAKLPVATRNLYTFPGNNIPGGGANLASNPDDYLLHEDTAGIDYNLLNISADPAYREELLRWIRVQPMGDPLHSKATTLNYPGGVKVVYAMTNQGFLHAFDATSPTSNDSPDMTGGEELFAFMPRELLSNIDNLKNSEPVGEHIYGLDGNITRWHNDDDNNGIVDGEETAMLVFGMRRGGNNYYAVDVTNPEQPVLKWQITGGEGDFAKLAQSWSRASLINVRRGIGVEREERVLVFGGGYDGTLDDSNAAAPSAGNTIFMVDSLGNFIWSASDSFMEFAIPSDLTVIDSDNDAVADRMYFGDLGSQIWRVDFGNVDQDSEFHVSRVADLAGNGYQPFLYPPSVALHERSAHKFISLGIGSGNRDMPLDENSSSAFYMLRDQNVDTGLPSADTQLITQATLFNATENDIGSTVPAIATAAKNALDAADGWRIDLEDGEKSLSQTLTFEGRLLATTFKPDSVPVEGSCAGGSTLGRYYMLDILDGTPVDYLGQTQPPSGAMTADNRYKAISSFGIPSAPVVLFPEGSGVVQIIVDKEAVSEVQQSLGRVLWHSR